MPKFYSTNYKFKLAKICQLCYILVNEYDLGKNMMGGHGNEYETFSQLSLTSNNTNMTTYDQYVMQLKQDKTITCKTKLDHYLEEEVFI